GTIAAVATSNAIAARGFTDLMLSSLDLAPKPPNGLARARRATPPPTTPSPWGPTSDSAHPRKPRLLSTMFGVTFRDSCLLGVAHVIDRDRLSAGLRERVSGCLGRALKPHHRYLVEKTPPHLASIPLMAEVFPEARFVNVVRDGRDVAVSMTAGGSWNPAWRLRGSRAMLGAGREWKAAAVL